MDGIEVARRLLQQPKVPLVFSSPRMMSTQSVPLKHMLSTIC